MTTETLTHIKGTSIKWDKEGLYLEHPANGEFVLMRTWDQIEEMRQKYVRREDLES